MAKTYISLLAEVEGNLSSVELLYKSMIYLRQYVRDMGYGLPYQTYMLYMIENLPAILKAKGYTENKCRCQYCGYEELKLNKEVDKGSVTVFYSAYSDSDMGKGFWQMMCDILDISVIVRCYKGGSKYNFILKREKDLSKRGLLIGR